MTHFVEPYIQDLVWLWLKQNSEYKQIGSEIGIGSDVNSGRIDLVGKTHTGEYHGFEVKNTAFADEQVNRYLHSNYFDKIFHCSRIGGEVADRLDQNEKIDSGTYQNQQIRKEVSNAIAAGQYSEDEYRQTLEERFPDSVLDQSVVLFESSRGSIDESDKTIRSRLTRNLGIPTADFDPSEDYISLEEAIEKMTNNHLLPSQIGVIDILLEINQIDDESRSDGFLLESEQEFHSAFSKGKWKEVEIVREAEKLEREHTPQISQKNEAWVQHHVWWELGDIREAVVPSEEHNKEYFIDVMAFEGGNSPAEAYQTEGKVIGVEAKGEGEFAGGHSRSIREQLLRYQNSGTLSHLYLAVPDAYVQDGKRVLNTESLNSVGLLTVSEEGDVDTIRNADQRKIHYDSYIKVSGDFRYSRSIGFGRIRPPDEPEHTAPCQVVGNASDP